MAFTPVISASGLLGFSLLQKTLPKQMEQFRSSADLSREVEYFRENIAAVKTPEDLVSNRRMLGVALNAYGLGEEIDKRAFVRKILDEGTSDRSAFAVRLNNPDYLAFARKFDFSSGSLNLSGADVDHIANQFFEQKFQEAVGDNDQDLRLTLNFDRKITEIAQTAPTQNAGWYSALANVPLRTLLETAFNLPTEFSSIDIDKQVEILSDKLDKKFGSPSLNVFLVAENRESMNQQFLLNRQIQNGPDISTPGFAALSLLSTGLGGGSSISAVLSKAIL